VLSVLNNVRQPGNEVSRKKQIQGGNDQEDSHSFRVTTLGTQGYKTHDKIIGFSMGHAAQETNHCRGGIQVQGMSECPWRAAGSGNTSLGHVCPVVTWFG